MPKKKQEVLLDHQIPFSLDAERGLLSSMLQSHDITSQVLVHLLEGDLYIPAHQLIATEIKLEWEKGRSVDLITFTQKMSDKNLLLQVGGATEITTIYTFAAAPENWLYYLEIVKEKAMARKLLTLCDGARKKIVDEPDSTKEMLYHLQTEVGLIESFGENKERTLADDVDDKIERMESGAMDKETVATGITKLDEMSPIKRGDFPVIAGKRKHGKSIMAITILENVCVKNRLTGVYFSLESPRSEVVDRIFAGVSRIPMDKHHSKFLTEGEASRAIKAATAIRESNLIVHDDIYELSQIVAKIRHTKASHPELALVVIDYCQLVQAPVKKGGTRQEEVATISRMLRLTALELKVPIIMLSQLNEQGASRESRAIEQDTTAFIVISREDEEDDTWRKISVPFQRNHMSGVSFECSFLGNLGRVENYAEEENGNKRMAQSRTSPANTGTEGASHLQGGLPT